MKVGGRDVPPPAAALLLLSLLAGCRQNPDETAQKSRETIDSWSSTVTMAGRQWVGGRVPDLFLRQVLQAAEESLGEQPRSLEKIPPADTRREQLERRLAAVRARVGQMSAGLERRDRGAVAALLDGGGDS